MLCFHTRGLRLTIDDSPIYRVYPFFLFKILTKSDKNSVKLYNRYFTHHFRHFRRFTFVLLFAPTLPHENAFCTNFLDAFATSLRYQTNFLLNWIRGIRQSMSSSGLKNCCHFSFSITNTFACGPIFSCSFAFLEFLDRLLRMIGTY